MHDERRPRRDILRSVGLGGIAVIGAGCMGDDGGEDGDATDDGAGDTGPEGDGGGEDAAEPTADPGECTPGHTEGDPPCQQIADDAENLVRFDASGTDLLVSFAYPCGWTTGTTDQFEDRFQANASRRQIGSGDQQTVVDIQVRVSQDPVEPGYVEDRTGSFQRVEYGYGGETRTAAVTHQTGDLDEQYGATAYAAVPYDGELYGVDLVPTVQGALCGAEVDDLVIAMVESLEPNDETTFTA